MCRGGRSIHASGHGPRSRARARCHFHDLGLNQNEIVRRCRKRGRGGDLHRGRGRRGDCRGKSGRECMLLKSVVAA